jgi:hypothetical protein
MDCFRIAENDPGLMIEHVMMPGGDPFAALFMHKSFSVILA